MASRIALGQMDFSADIANPKAASPFQTRIFATRGKLRFQQEDRGGHANSIMLVDLTALTSVVLMPQQYLYVKESRPQIPGQGVAFFQPKDVKNACVPWQKMADLKGKCRNLGDEAVNDRDTVKYDNVAADKTMSYIWIDKRLHFPVRWEGPTGTSELRNIREAPQAADLFKIPPGYTKRTLAAPPQKPES
ncbi:MAG TPA: hypothetical protein VI386_03950 [Candidatus Sulfotelmatobacter sp.]